MIDRKSLEKSYWTLTEIHQNASVLNPVRIICHHFVSFCIGVHFTVSCCLKFMMYYLVLSHYLIKTKENISHDITKILTVLFIFLVKTTKVLCDD